MFPEEVFDGKYECYCRQGLIPHEELITDDFLQRVKLGGEMQVIIRIIRYIFTFSIKTFRQEKSREWLLNYCNENGICGFVTRTDVFTISGEFHAHDINLIDNFVTSLDTELKKLTGVLEYSFLPQDFHAIDYHFYGHRSSYGREDGVNSWDADMSVKLSVAGKNPGSLAGRMTKGDIVAMSTIVAVN